MTCPTPPHPTPHREVTYRGVMIFMLAASVNILPDDPTAGGCGGCDGHVFIAHLSGSDYHLWEDPQLLTPERAYLDLCRDDLW